MTWVLAGAGMSMQTVRRCRAVCAIALVPHAMLVAAMHDAPPKRSATALLLSLPRRLRPGQLLVAAAEGALPAVQADWQQLQQPAAPRPHTFVTGGWRMSGAAPC